MGISSTESSQIEDLENLRKTEEELKQSIITSQYVLQKKIELYGAKMWWNGMTLGFLAGSFTVIILEVMHKWRK